MSPPEARLLVGGPAPGAWNMALDEVLMEGARAGRVTLRFYRWAPPCLSFGRHQRARGAWDADAVAARGFDAVRRPTGGRAVLHRRELTYSVTAPVELWGGTRAAYARINRALARGLAALGAPVTLEGGVGRSPAPGSRRRSPRPGTRACFRDPVEGEVAAAGRKLVGSAQWREGGSLLQHGSILLHDDQPVVEELRADGRASRGPQPAGRGKTGPGGVAMDRSGARPSAAPVLAEEGATEAPTETPPATSAAVGLAEVLGSLPGLSELVEALGRGFTAETGIALVPGEAAPAEVAAARRLEGGYRDPAWTWRR